MVTKADYGTREVEAAKSVLIELIHLLGVYNPIYSNTKSDFIRTAFL